MFFRDIIGQDKLKQRLIRSVQEERVSHAQLFSGPEGSGKLGLALAYAQYISCRDRSETDSCGVCPSCRKYAKMAHPDFHFVFPIFTPKNTKKPTSDEFLQKWREMVLKSPYFSINQWAAYIGAENAQLMIYAHESDAIIRKLSMKPYEAEFKVMIIWLPEKMNISCSNKLLKMIEEPPFKTLFLLVTEDEGSIITTIRSRTQIIKIPRISETDLQEALVKTGEYDPELIAEMVHKANGNYMKALEYVNPDDDKRMFFSSFQKIMRFAYQNSVAEMMEMAEELASIGRERQKDFFLYALQLTREFFILNFGKPSLVYLTREEKEWGQKFSPFINERNIVALNRLFEEGYLHISMNGNARIVLTDTLLTLIRLIR